MKNNVVLGDNSKQYKAFSKVSSVPLVISMETMIFDKCGSRCSPTQHILMAATSRENSQSTRAFLWLDNKNREMFGSLKADLPKTNFDSRPN